ncbi:hypothetical protein [Candidatus Phytoplasma fraxini]|uniref:Transmembrane protein n=1 Tax=Ash yellows phytoplasma TaxID=35780 RepID=A0ABZ2UBV8_ASHYP
MLNKFQEYFSQLNGWPLVGIIVFLLFLSGPILFVIIKICQFLFYVIKFNFNFLINNFNFFPKEQKQNNDIPKSSNISINNTPPVQHENLSLIELKMIELKQREYNNKNQQSQQNNFLKLEIDQKIHQNKIEDKFEIYKLEQKMSILEKEIQKLSINSSLPNSQNVNEEKSNLNNVENEILTKQIPESLKEIFEKISDFENVQLYMLNKIMDNNHNKASYYDSNKNVLYVNPQDLNFFKTFLINKQKENKRLN